MLTAPNDKIPRYLHSSPLRIDDGKTVLVLIARINMVEMLWYLTLDTGLYYLWIDAL